MFILQHSEFRNLYQSFMEDKRGYKVRYHNDLICELYDQYLRGVNFDFLYKYIGR